MINRFLLAFGLILSLTSSSQTNCQKFRNGTFYYPDIPGKISVRKGSIQKSYNEGRLEMIWKVKWLSNCKFEMICEKILVDNNSIKRGDRIVANIIATDASCFTSELVFYSKEIPEGEKLPGGPLCIKKN
jgi:hypothetical protein